MAERITRAMLRDRINRLNRDTGMPEHQFSPNGDGDLKANVGHYLLDETSGGVALVQIATATGAERNVMQCGYVTKRELWQRLGAFEAGMAEQCRIRRINSAKAKATD